MDDEAPQRQVGVGFAFGGAAVALFVVANLFAAGARDAAAIFCLALSVLALLAAIIALFPRFAKKVYEVLEWLGWWV